MVTYFIIGAFSNDRDSLLRNATYTCAITYSNVLVFIISMINFNRLKLVILRKNISRDVSMKI